MKRAEDLPMVSVKCEDILGAISIAQSNKCVQNLSQGMRDILTDALKTCLAGVSEEAWTYYSLHDVPITEETIPLLKTIVTYHYNRGE
jgi:hypothetical protein